MVAAKNRARSGGIEEALLVGLGLALEKW